MKTILSIEFYHPQQWCQPGVSKKKIEVARGLDRVTDYINKGPLVPFSRGGGGGGVKACFAPENFEISQP